MRICRVDGQASWRGSCQMATNTLPATYTTDDPMLRLAVAAHLARYKGESRAHTASDLGSYLRWCFEQGVRPLQAQRGHVELYLRWLQGVRRLKPSTVSRRLSVLATFYRTCVIDDILEHSPAEYVRRPPVPPESPTLGLNHLQFEAMLSAGRDSANPNDFALVVKRSPQPLWAPASSTVRVATTSSWPARETMW